MKSNFRLFLLLLIIASISFAQERISLENGSLKIKYLENSTYSVEADSFATISEFLVQYHDGSQYNNDYRSRYQYNTMAKVSEITDQYWSGSDWENDFRILFDYDASGNNTMTTFQNYSGSSWENSSRKVVVCDTNGNPIHQENQNWMEQSWVPYLANDNVYNQVSKLVQTITSQYNYWDPTPQWILQSKSTYTYNQDDKLTTRKSFSPGPDSNWFPLFQEDYRYNSDGLEQSKKSIVSDDSGATWKPFVADTTAYNNNKNRTYHKREYYNGSNWQNDYLVQSTYNGDLEIERQETIWSRTSNNMSRERYVFTYNQQNMLNDVLEQYWNNGAWENMWHDYYSYNQLGYHSEIESFFWNMSSWIPLIKYLMTYSMVVEVYDHSELIKDFVLYQNYPNPFNSMTKIIYYLPTATDVSLKLFNAIGQEVKLVDSGFKLPGKYEITIDEFSLSSGVYYYQLITKLGETTKKMILIK